MTRFTVTVETLTTSRTRHSTHVLAEDAIEAQRKGLRKLFGPHAFWHVDYNGQYGTDLGQVFENLPNTGNGWSASSLTPRARLDISQGWS